jgi:hypothetical protein
MLAPLYEWLQAGGQQPVTAVQQQQLEQLQQQLAPCPMPLQAQQPVLTGEASASGDASGAAASGSPSSSSAPTVSQPSSGSAQHAVHSHSHHGPHHHQQFLQQEDQLYHPHGHGHGHHVPLGAADNNGAPGAAAAAAAAMQQHCAGATSGASDESDDADYDDDDFDPLVFIGTLGPVEHYALPGRQPLLPRQTRQCKQKTLVLDLDETLVHSTLDAACGVGADFSFPVTFNGAEHMVHVRQRPHMREFLESVAAMFEVVVFTASQKVRRATVAAAVQQYACMRVYGGLTACVHACGVGQLLVLLQVCMLSMPALLAICCHVLSDSSSAVNCMMTCC